MARLRIGIIGAGRFAATHMEAFARIPQAQVVAFMRRDPVALQAMQEEWSVAQGYTDHRELLADPDIDAIDIITPTDSHCQYALDAIAAGKHVLWRETARPDRIGLQAHVGRCPRRRCESTPRTSINAGEHK